MTHNPNTQDLLNAIGNTPLIRLRAVSEATGCDIFGKAEFMNPGGSVKDRAALAIIEDAEESGALRQGGMIVEGTAGNTGIGLTMVGNAKGYTSVIVMPETQSQERRMSFASSVPTCVSCRQSRIRTPGTMSAIRNALPPNLPKRMMPA